MNILKSYKLKINNLDCANCARIIEEKLNKDEKLENVIINFSKSTISLNSDVNNIIDYLNKKIEKIEDGVTVSEKEERNKSKYLINLLIGIVLILISLIIKNKVINEIIIIISYIVLLEKTFFKALKSLSQKVMNENFLIVISCIGAYFVDKKMEGLMVIILYTIGKILEEKAVYKSRKNISELMNIKVEKANIKKDNSIVEIDSSKIKVGDILVVRKGEKVAVDGIIVKGETSLDLQSLNGESKPREVEKGDEVSSGSINLEGVIEIKALKEYKDSNVSKIINLIEEATDKKAKKETRVSKWAKVYTPAVFILSILVGVLLPIITNLSYKESIYRALTFLVISCPCAIAISVPLAYYSGIGKSSKEGILIKGSDVLDYLRKIDTICFDKTGTITTGKFKVKKIVSLDNKYDENDIFKYIYNAEIYSIHPIAKTVLDYKREKKLQISNPKEYTGKGITYEYENKKYKVGSKKFTKYKEEEKENTYIYLSIEEKVVGYIELEDEIKNNTKDVVNSLKKNNINVYMFSGDKKEVAEKVSKKVNIENVKYEMLPQDKYNEINSLKEENRIVSFVGDGINDALVLKTSDVGISMGLKGTSAAIEASDVVIMNDDISKIKNGIDISKKTDIIINENLILAFSIKILILILSIFGISTMWQAVFADVGVTLIAILNTLRILKGKKN